jgi:hypothetical protein
MSYEKIDLKNLPYSELLNRIVIERVNKNCSCGSKQKEHAKNCQDLENEIERREHNKR